MTCAGILSIWQDPVNSTASLEEDFTAWAEDDDDDDDDNRLRIFCGRFVDMMTLKSKL